jgi:uncharacterized protein
MTSVYVDAGAWIAMVVSQDAHHREARDFFHQLPATTELVTSNLVLSETYTWMRYHRQPRGAITIKTMVQESERLNRLEVVFVTRDLHEAAWDLFEQYEDHAFSFSDCVGVVIARRQNVDYVFGFDADFRTIGFDLRP